MQVVVVDIDTLVRNWWVVLLRGILGIVFGVVTFFAPGISLTALVLLFGAFAFVDGILAIIGAIRRHQYRDRATLDLVGSVAIDLFSP